VVHIYFLITARYCFIVAFTWLWDYVTFQRGARLITEVPPEVSRARDERLLCDKFVFQIGLLLRAEESDIKLPALEVVRKRCRMVARNPDFNIEQFVAKNARCTRQPISFLSG
jgi:hypothetical protein